MNAESDRSIRGLIPPLVIYYALLSAYFAASFYPELRLWGVNPWDEFPIFERQLLFGLAVAAPAAVVLLRRLISRFMPATESREATYWFVSLSILLILSALFYILRADTWFLGDGYTVLALLSSDNPIIKQREIGEAMAHLWLKSLFGSGNDAALKSFQTISIGSGIFLLTATLLSARRLFERLSARITFLLGIASSGFMLLSFGYVENYSLFVLSMVVYCLVGLRVMLDKEKGWLLLPLTVLTIIFHIFGVCLIPATTYALATRTELGSRLVSGVSRSLRFILGALVLTGSVAGFAYFYTTSYFFRFSLLQFSNNRFALDGYWILSADHLLDILNLVLLLLPGIVLILWFAFAMRWIRLARQPVYRWLGILIASTFGIVFLFDPKIGMPRDWDLFSFAGVPLCVGFYYLIASHLQKIKWLGTAATLSICLGFLSLIPRVLAQTRDEIAMARFMNLIDLDTKKNKNASQILYQVYSERNDQQAILELSRRWMSEYPELSVINQANELKKQKKYTEAIARYDRVMELNPGMPEVYSNVADCHLYLGRFDSATTLARISIGLGPYRTAGWSALGSALYMKKDIQEAEKAWLRAHELDKTAVAPAVGLAVLYNDQKQFDKSFRFLKMADVSDETPVSALVLLAKMYYDRDNQDDGFATLKRAVDKGLDSSWAADFLKQLTKP